ncbi:MAG: hypothetical protein AB8G11_16445 [Saprospiraceae bacterium]
MAHNVTGSKAFTLVKIKDNTYALKVGSKYVSIKKNENYLIANTQKLNEATHFRFEKLPNNKYALKTTNGKYLRIDKKKNNSLVVVKDKNKREIFTLEFM